MVTIFQRGKNIQIYFNEYEDIFISRDTARELRDALNSEELSD